MKTAIYKLGPVLIIFFSVLIFFYPVWLKGLVPLPADIVVGVNYPWLDQTWPGFAAGIPVKNPITSDVISFAYPMRISAIDFLKGFNIPLWNPFILSGTPLLANFQSAPFSITNLFYFVLPEVWGWSIQVMIQPLLGALFLYLSLRDFRLSRFTAIVGGLIFAFAGFSMIWLEWNAHSLVAAFFPLIFLLTLRWFKTGNFIYGSLISVGLALQIFAGYPQIIIYELLGLLILILVFRQESFSKIGNLVWWILFIALGVGLAAIQALPAQELLSLSQRQTEIIPDQWTFLPWQLLITFLVPDFFGNHATYNFWGPGNYTLITGYSGIIATTLALAGLITGFKLREVRFAALLLIASLLLVLPTPLSIALKNSYFLGLQAGTAHRALVLFNLGIAILAAFGLQNLLTKKLGLKQMIASFSFTAFSLLGLWLFVTVFWKQFLADDYLIKMAIAKSNLILPSLLLLVSFSLTAMSLLVKGRRRYLVYLLGVVVVLELFRFGWKYTPFSPPAWVFPQTAVTNFLQAQQPPFRTLAAGVIPTNFMMVYKLDVTEGYDALYPLQYAQYLATLNSGSAQSSPQDRYGAVNNLNSPLLNLTNTKYILVLKKDEQGRVSPSGKIPGDLTKIPVRSVFEDGSVVVLEKMDVLPRAKMFYEWDVESDNKVILQKLTANYPISQKIIVDREPMIRMAAGQSRIDLSDYQGERKIQVQTDSPGLLFVADSWYPGWISLVDGNRVELLKADYNFMAVPIKTAGDHIVELKYQPGSFEIGKMISFLSLLMVLMLLLFSLKSKKSKV